MCNHATVTTARSRPRPTCLGCARQPRRDKGGPQTQAEQTLSLYLTRALPHSCSRKLTCRSTSVRQHRLAIRRVPTAHRFPVRPPPNRRSHPTTPNQTKPRTRTRTRAAGAGPKPLYRGEAAHQLRLLRLLLRLLTALSALPLPHAATLRRGRLHPSPPRHPSELACRAERGAARSVCDETVATKRL